MDIFTLNKISYRYPQKNVWALQNIDLSIRQGEFVLVIGPSGCGKSTLVRLLGGLIPSFYGGTISGSILYKDQSMLTMDQKRLPGEVGFLFQDPENQIVMGKVEADIAFGCENLGLEFKLMQRRVLETLNFLGLTELRDRSTHLISSGQKQKVALGSLLAMGPKVFIFDEPTSQLDPQSCQLFFNLVRRLHQEEGATIILVEHHYDEAFPLADRVLYFENGECRSDMSPRDFLNNATEEYMPIVSRIFQNSSLAQIPLTTREGREVLKKVSLKEDCPDISDLPKVNSPTILEVKDVLFRYQRDHIDPTLDRVTLNVRERESLALLGENGAGKSTLLKLMAGLLTPQKGSIYFRGQDIQRTNDKTRALSIGLLTQNPNDYLFHDSVGEEVAYTMNNLHQHDPAWKARLFEMLDIGDLEGVYPRELSCGQKQRVALASVLIARPKILLCDEPTRGLDTRLKNKLLTLFRQLKEESMSIVLATQDVDFAAEFADRVVLVSKGKILDEGRPIDILDNNLFFSTRVNKLFQGLGPKVVTLSEARQQILGAYE